MNFSSVSIGPLAVRQTAFSKEALAERYDLCVGVASWETRAVTGLMLIPTIEAQWEIWAFDSSDKGRAAAKAACIESLRKSRTESIEVIPLAASLQFERNFKLIESRISNHSREKGRPIDILFDITCLPKKYILFALAMGIRNEYVRHFDFIYSEGAYKSALGTTAERLKSWKGNEGEWSSVQIPYLEAATFIPDHRGLIVSLGAEISASVPFIERYEPTRISLISVENDPRRVDTAAIENDRKMLHELERLPVATSHKLSIHDVIGVANLCRSFCRERPDLSVTALAIGSKPHALGLGLAALDVPNLEIVCRLPSNYVADDVVPTGRVFLYTARDRFEPQIS